MPQAILIGIPQQRREVYPEHHLGFTGNFQGHVHHVEGLHSGTVQVHQAHLLTSCTFFLIQFDSILNGLEKNSKVCKENDDPEKRKYAIIGVQSLVSELGFCSDIMGEK